ncbi:MAG: lysophospholipase [Acidimicrobiia bacterium]|nr:lysophospholipase [Acidimicrobiia bacterium]MBT8214097.1 lysophospholipase [Acidimicrobiia bacterium]NNF68666.1 alpha/beta hydrolase [Acidimicrobiia bacterium]NNK92043.1 alpha/beta hydrolase [Acidimicrobiia bacterium]
MDIDTYTAPDGSQLLTRLWRAANRKASVLVVHGLGEHSGRYLHVGERLAEAGYDTLAFDLRGHGDTEEPGHVETFEHYLDDVAALLSDLEGPTVLLGHSMGGLISIRYAVSDRPQPDYLVVSAPALGADVPAYKRVAARLLGRIAPKLSLPNDISGDQLAADPAIGDAYFADPLVYTKTTARLGYELLLAMDHVEGNHSGLQTPTLVIHGGADTVVPARFSVTLGGHPLVERKLFPTNRHESFNEGPEALEYVIGWLDAQMASA